MLNMLVTLCLIVGFVLWALLIWCGDQQIEGVSHPGCKSKRKP